MMKTMITETGVTFKELEKIVMHGYVRWGGSLPESSWSCPAGNVRRRSVKLRRLWVMTRWIYMYR